MIKVPGLESYNGSKSGNGVYQQIISIIPPHTTLIVPFLGHCGIVRNILPADILIAMDASEKVIEAWKTFLVQDLIYKSKDNGLTFLKTPETKGNLPNKIVLIKCNALEQLPKLSFDPSLTVIYLDPPYPLDSIKSKRNLYEFVLTKKEHTKLMLLLKSMMANILISTYDNVLYKKGLSGWDKIKFSAGTRNGKNIETVYFNYSLSNGRLHDYRYLGSNFKDRERIRLKIKRWTERLNKLNPREKMAIIQALKQN